jgi:hypothetical protein
MVLFLIFFSLLWVKFQKVKNALNKQTTRRLCVPSRCQAEIFAYEPSLKEQSKLDFQLALSEVREVGGVPVLCVWRRPPEKPLQGGAVPALPSLSHPSPPFWSHETPFRRFPSIFPILWHAVLTI